jgi:hypothetical protein
MEGEGTLKSCQTNLIKDDHRANTKCKRLHLPPLHDDVESTSRMTLFEAGGDDTGWLLETTTSCASTTSILKSDIIEASKRRKKKNPVEEAWKRHKKKEVAAEAGTAKAGPTPAKASLHEPAPFLP